jgi:hypothetical protein
MRWCIVNRIAGVRLVFIDNITVAEAVSGAVLEAV